MNFANVRFWIKDTLVILILIWYLYDILDAYNEEFRPKVKVIMISLSLKSSIQTNFQMIMVSFTEKYRFWTKFQNDTDILDIEGWTS